MTLPGIFEGALIVTTGIVSFVSTYRFKSYIVKSLLGGMLFVLVGNIVIYFDLEPNQTLLDVWRLNETDFYQGTIILALGVGLIIGSAIGWLVTKIISGR